MFFINLIFALIPFLGFSQELPGTINTEEYCNQRFAFCVTYPDGYFSEKQYSDNGDGVSLSSQDGTLKLEVTGAYNIMNWSVEGVIDNYFKVVKKKPMEVELLELYADESYGLAKMKYNHEIQLFQVNLLKDSYVATIITVPASAPEILDHLASSIQISFPI